MIKKKVVIPLIISVLVGIVLIRQVFVSKKHEKINMNQVFIEEKEEVTNQLTEVETIKVHITGEVNNPGLLELVIGSRIDDAIKLAGGLTDRADISKTNLAYILSDGEKIYIPNESDDEISFNNTQISNNKVNINNASVSELKTIPGVGESTANSIVEYRNKNRKIYYNRRH